jgi:membrane protein implicated in regulation of membrane protease activity
MNATLWLLVAAACFGVEIGVSSFWFLWFGVAALINCVLVYAGIIPNLPAQLIVFSALSVVFLIFTRPLLVKLLGKRETKSNVDAMIGRTGLCTLTIVPFEVGQVKVRGEIWTAFAEEKIEAGRPIIVEAVVGVKLKVSKYEAVNPEADDLSPRTAVEAAVPAASAEPVNIVNT